MDKLASITPNVEGFITYLSGAVTQYDMRAQKKRGYNIYALGHYLGAVGKIRDDTDRVKHSQEPEALEALKASIKHRFTPGFPPADKTVKAIDAFLASGDAPMYPGVRKHATSVRNAFADAVIAHRVAARFSRRATINDSNTLGQLIEMEIESISDSGSSRGVDFDIGPDVKRKAEAFDKAVEKVLTDWAKKNLDKCALGQGPLTHAKDADDVVSVMLDLRGGAGYLYYMEAEGHGVGTWDGDWDVLFVDPKATIKELSGLVKSKTNSQYHALKQAIENVAFEAVPETQG